jgi:UDPglucose--hexose-1-phosphate uridylyltransferase
MLGVHARHEVVWMTEAPQASPELRKDPVIGRWVIIAGERSSRPNPFRSYPTKVAGTGPCPFCPGQERMTPNEVLRLQGDGGAAGPGWLVRVVPNRYPALRIEGSQDKRGEGLYDRMRGIGAHEIVIETPQHDTAPPQFSAPQMAAVIEAYRERITDLLRDERFRYVLVFKNHGEPAGASLSHHHSQIIAMPIVPVRIEAELHGASQYYEFRGRCIYCDVVQQELSDARRLVTQNDAYVAIAPYASRFPFEVSILPRFHDAFFWSLSGSRVGALAEIVQDVLRRYAPALNEPPYNYVIHTAPPGYAHAERYHWHVEVMPKLTEAAGFEWGSGFFINPTPPEEAARHLRELERFMDVPEGHLLVNPVP